MYYEGDVFEIETKEVTSEKDFKIREKVAELSAKAKEAIEKRDMVTDKLERDPRINFENMKLLPTFLDNMEYGSKTDSSVVKSQLLSFSNGNAELVNEFSNDKEFMSNIQDAIELRKQLNKEMKELPKLFADADYSLDESTTDYIIYKAENGQYDLSDRETFEAEFASDFADLIDNTEHRMMQGERSIDHYLEELMSDRYQEKLNAGISDELSYYRQAIEMQGSNEVSEDFFDRRCKQLLETLESYSFQVESKDFKPVYYKIMTGAYDVEETEFFKEITKDLVPFIPTKENQEVTERQWELNSKLNRTTLENAGEEIRELRMRVRESVDQAIEQMTNREIPDLLTENKSFQFVYSGLKNGDFTGRTEIRKTLEAVKAPKIDDELLDKLVEINKDSYFLKEIQKHVEKLEQNELSERLQEVENNFSEARDLYKNREHDLATKVDLLKEQNEALKKENEQLKQEKEQKPRRSFFGLER